MEQQTWVTLIGAAGFALALFSYLGTMKRDLRADVGDVRTELRDVRTELRDTRVELKGDIAEVKAELKGDIAEVKAELKGDIAEVKADIGKLDGRLVTLEQRTYDLSTRLPAPPPASNAR